MHEIRVVGGEVAQQPVDLLQRQLGRRAYNVVTDEYPMGQPVVMGDVALVYTAATMNRPFVDEQMLPIEEFSK